MTKMTVPRENSENPPCTQCRLLRKSFVVIAMSAVMPIIVFSALLLLMDVGNMDMEYRSVGSVIIESVAGILHVQLFVATALLIASVTRRRRIYKYRMWYLIFHVLVMTLSFVASVVLTIINESYNLLGATVVIILLYFYVVFNFLNVVRYKMCSDK